LHINLRLIDTLFAILHFITLESLLQYIRYAIRLFFWTLYLCLMGQPHKVMPKGTKSWCQVIIWLNFSKTPLTWGSTFGKSLYKVKISGNLIGPGNTIQLLFSRCHSFWPNSDFKYVLESVIYWYFWKKNRKKYCQITF